MHSPKIDVLFLLFNLSVNNLLDPLLMLPKCTSCLLEILDNKIFWKITLCNRFQHIISTKPVVDKKIKSNIM